MKKKTMILAVLLAGILGLSGCKAWDVVCDVLAVNTTKVEKDKEPKVDLDGSVPEIKDEEITEETADNTITEESASDSQKDTKKKADKNSTTVTPTPTPTPTHIPEKDTIKTAEKGHKITCVSPVNVRDAASSQSRVIGELAKGDQVEKLGEDGGWIKIRYKGATAWVYEDYMSEKNSRTEKEKTE